MSRPKKQKEYMQNIPLEQGVPADKSKKIARECFLHKEEIEGREYMVGIDSPYINLYFCEDAYKELRSNGEKEYVKWFQDHAEEIFSYAETMSSYKSTQKSKLMDKKGKK